jgi:hypothetical protein
MTQPDKETTLKGLNELIAEIQKGLLDNAAIVVKNSRNIIFGKVETSGFSIVTNIQGSEGIKFGEISATRTEFGNVLPILQELVTALETNQSEPSRLKRLLARLRTYGPSWVALIYQILHNAHYL